MGLPRATWGMVAAHAGIAIVALGIVGVTAFQEEAVASLKPGGSISVGGYKVALVSVVDAQGPNYTTKVGTFAISGRVVDTLIAERRYYPNPGSETTEAGLRLRPLDVLYVT